MNKSVEWNKLKEAQTNIVLEIDGQLHLVGMKSDRLEAVDTFIKSAVEVVVPTKRTQKELRDFLGIKQN